MIRTRANEIQAFSQKLSILAFGKDIDSFNEFSICSELNWSTWLKKYYVIYILLEMVQNTILRNFQKLWAQSTLSNKRTTSTLLHTCIMNEYFTAFNSR